MKDSSWKRIVVVVTLIVINIHSISSMFLIRDDHVAKAATLTSVLAQPTSNIVTTKASYEILFTTATTGAIKTVTIAFPTGFNVGLVSVIERSGIGVGLLSASGTTVTYTVTSPVGIAAGIPIRFELSNIIHPGIPGTYSVSITTKNALGNTIDGPTTGGTSSVVQIGTAAISNGAVTNPKLGVNSVSTNNIVNGSVTGSKVASGAVLLRHENLFGCCYESSVTLGPGQLGNVETKLCTTIGGSADDIAVAVSYFGSNKIDIKDVIDEGGYWIVAALNTDQVNSQTLKVFPTCIDIVPNSKQ